MAVNKLTPRYLNKDDDERLIKSVEMTDALNIRISTDEDGDALVLKNAYGNTAVDLDKSLPAGTNKVIGSISDEQLGYIFYFVWNSNDDHSIYRYSVGANKAFRVIKDSVLEFTQNGFVKGNIFVNNGGDVLLYFNDGLTAPKKINSTKALVNGYTQLLTGTDAEKLAVLSVLKAPPLDPPSYNIVNNPDLKENNIKDNVFQFTYKYIYADGEHSALSPYSSLTVSTNQLRRGFTNTGQDDFFNQINVFLKHSSSDVDKIVLYAREGNEGAFYEVEEVNNVIGGSTATVNFTNSKQGVALPSNEQNKLYDNVPQQADSQEITGGRLMYGGYTEGYENISTDVDLDVNYGYGGTIYDVDIAATASGALTFGLPNFENIPSSGLPAGSRVYINISINGDYFEIGGTGSNKLNWDDVRVTHTKRDGTGADSIVLTKAEDPIKFLSSGIHISSVLDFSTATSRANVISDIITAITSQKYNVSLKSANGEATNLENAGINFAEETAVFDAHAVFTAEKKSTVNEIEFKLSELDLYIRQLFIASVQREILSAPVIHMEAPGDTLVYTIDSPYTAGGLFASEDEVESRAFKSGSNHKLGVVYYDENNRSGGVQELDQVYVEALNDRSDENDLYGPASIVMRMQHTPPVWAKRWAPVYSGRGRNELKLMYGVAGAFIPFRDDINLQISPARNIYLSLNTIFSKSLGYNSATGANLDYVYSKGDRLRIISYDGDQRTTSEFNVVGLEELDGGDNNPILDKSSSRSLEYTTGPFVVIEENKSATGFTIDEIVDRSSNWFKQCVIEIYNPNKEIDGIYYEIGKNYEVQSNAHVGERTSTSVAITVTQGTATAVEFNTETKVFKGDVLVLGGVTITVGNVYQKGTTYYAYATANTTAVTGTYTVSNTEAVVQLELGDVYFRRRSVFTSAQNKTNSSTGDEAYPILAALARYVEDYSVSDFFASKSSSIGRPIAYIPDAKTIKRRGSITYSDYDSEDSIRLNLSSFNLSLANFKDLAYEHGSIKYLVGYNEALYFLQEKRCGVAAVGRQILQTGSGDNLVSLSTNVIGNERYYVGEYGLGNHPESVAFKDGMTYFADVNANKVVRIDNQGLTVISDVGMKSYFEDKFASVSKYNSHLVSGGIDDDNGHYIVHSPELETSTVDINTDEYSYEVSLDSTGTQVTAPVQYNPSAVFGFLNDPRTFDEICDAFDDSVEAVVYLDQLSSGAPIYVNLPYQASNVLGVATNSDFDFFVMIRVNMFLPGFIFDNGYCDGDDSGSINADGTLISSFTAAYDMYARKWSTLYSFSPERVDSVHANMYTFDGGKIYRHDETADRNSWYGGDVEDSVVEVVSNASPSAIKTFESISLEGNSAWAGTVSTSNQTASLAESSFKEKEGFYYSYIHGATSSYGATISSVSSTSEIFVIGEVSADVTGTDVTFANAITTAFPLGTTSTLYAVDGSDLISQSVNPVSVSGKTVTFSGSVTATAGDLLVAVGDSAIEGDQIRDYYSKIKINKATTEPIELFAINTIIADSKAHN